MVKTLSRLRRRPSWRGHRPLHDGWLPGARRSSWGRPTPREHQLGRRVREAGMTTAEYAIGTIAACTFAALLIAVVRSPEIKAALLGIITRALGLGT